MKILLSFLAITLLSIHIVGAQITLESSQNKARKNYPLIKQYDLLEQSKEYSLSNANKAYLPQLDINLIGGLIEGLPSFSTPGSTSSSGDFKFISVLQLNQVIWDGGITKANKEIIEAQYQIEKADLEVSLYALEDRVNNLFFGVLLIEEQEKQLQSLVSTLDRNYKRVEVALQNGTAFKSDLDEIKVEIIKSNQKIEELKFNQNAYRNILAAMIGEQIKSDIDFVWPNYNENLVGLENNRPELSLFNNQINLISAKENMNKAFLYPKLGLMGFGTFIQPGVDFGTSTIDHILVAGLSLNWSIGALYKNSNNKKLLELNLEKVNTQKETFLFNTNLELDQVRLEMDKYQALIEQDKELLSLKSNIKNAYEVKYENGIATLSELLNKTNDEHVAKQNLTIHEIQYLMKLYQYKNRSGN